jgi:hypothetical protein
MQQEYLIDKRGDQWVVVVDGVPLLACNLTQEPSAQTVAAKPSVLYCRAQESMRACCRLRYSTIVQIKNTASKFFGQTPVFYARCGTERCMLGRCSPTKAVNLRKEPALWPYRPAFFSSTYSRIVARTEDGSWGAANIRLITAALKPEALCCPTRSVHVVLRQSPRAIACWLTTTNPAARKASPISLIFEFCRAFIALARPGDADGLIATELPRFLRTRPAFIIGVPQCSP